VETAGPPADQPDRLAIPINQPAAAYPDALVSENVAGYAKVSCQVSAQGEVGNPQIVEASHPAFGIAAFSAALQWTFQPAVRNHQYVESTVVIPFNFSPPGVTVSTETPPPPAAVAVEAPPAAPPTASAAVDLTALSPDDADAQQRKAEVLLYLHDHPDSEATPVNPIAPSYPAQLKPNGDVTGARIVETSNPLFGSAALTATRMSRFLPAIKSHQFSASTVVLTFEFTAASPVAASGNPALSPDDIADQQKLAEVLLYLRDQPDSDATPINPIAPSYPAQLKPGGGSGSARISCRITADGDATGARIVEASNPLFGSAALTAIRMSRFIPAIKDHQFVDSTVTIPVNFPAPGR
jgi:TonB family protein